MPRVLNLLPLLLLLLFSLIIAQIILFTGIASAKSPTDGVTKVFFNNGSFEHSGGISWTEKRANGQTAFYFEEQNRTETAILLFDPTRSVHISLIIADNDIVYSHKGEQFRKLYTITRVIRGVQVQQAPQPLKCGKNYKLVGGNCVLRQNCGPNAFRNVEGDCHCRKGYRQVNGRCIANKQINKPKRCGKNLELKNGKCVWKTDKNGFEISPWLKPQCKGLEKACSQGNGTACRKYEEQCQVN